jgi:hypothetical protein
MNKWIEWNRKDAFGNDVKRHLDITRVFHFGYYIDNTRNQPTLVLKIDGLSDRMVFVDEEATSIYKKLVSMTNY